MSIRVRLFATFRELFGFKETEVAPGAAPTLGALLDLLADTPARRLALREGPGLKPHVVVMVNGAPAPPEGFANVPLKDGDVVAVFPLMGGG